MACPVCKKPLIVYQLDGVELDHCLACKGTWLDAGELELIGELAGVGRGEISRALGVTGTQAKGGRTCPRCARKMEKIVLAGANTLEVDRCPLGHGMWFDQGELRRAVGACEGGEAGAVADFFREMYMSELAEPAGSQPMFDTKG